MFCETNNACVPASATSTAARYCLERGRPSAAVEDRSPPGAHSARAARAQYRLYSAIAPNITPMRKAPHTTSVAVPYCSRKRSSCSIIGPLLKLAPRQRMHIFRSVLYIKRCVRSSPQLRTDATRIPSAETPGRRCGWPVHRTCAGACRATGLHKTPCPARHLHRCVP